MDDFLIIASGAFVMIVLLRWALSERAAHQAAEAKLEAYQDILKSIDDQSENQSATGTIGLILLVLAAFVLYLMNGG